MKGITNATSKATEVVQNTSKIEIGGTSLQVASDSQPGIMSAADHTTLSTTASRVGTCETDVANAVSQAQAAQTTANGCYDDVSIADNVLTFKTASGDSKEITLPSRTLLDLGGRISVSWSKILGILIKTSYLAVHCSKIIEFDNVTFVGVGVSGYTASSSTLTLPGYCLDSTNETEVVDQLLDHYTNLLNNFNHDIKIKFNFENGSTGHSNYVSVIHYKDSNTTIIDSYNIDEMVIIGNSNTTKSAYLTPILQSVSAP